MPWAATAWSLAAARDFAADEVGVTLSWHFYTGLDLDWRTDIYWAGAESRSEDQKPPFSALRNSRA